MNPTLLKKLLIGSTVIVSSYLCLITILYHDLTTPCKSLWRKIMPSLLIAAGGLMLNTILTQETLLTEILPLKSWFARSILSASTIPCLAASIRAIFIPSALISIIDKLIYSWKGWRIPMPLVILIIGTICYTAYQTLVIAGTSTAKEILEYTQQLNTGAKILTAALLAIIQALVVIIGVSRFKRWYIAK